MDMANTTALKLCRNCHIGKPVDEFYRDCSKKDGKRAECKTCVNKWTTKYAKSPAGKISKRKTQQKYYYGIKSDPVLYFKEKEKWNLRIYTEKNRAYNKRRYVLLRKKGFRPKNANKNLANFMKKNPQKRRAWGAVWTEISAGRMLPAKKRKCHACGANASHYHHHKGYDEIHKLDVIPLCSWCHATDHVEKTNEKRRILRKSCQRGLAPCIEGI